MKYILKSYIHSYLFLCKVQISLHDSSTFFLVLCILHKLNSDRLKKFYSPKDYRWSCKPKCFVFQLCQNEFKRAASSALIQLQVLGLVTTLLFCALTFALKVWNFFFPSQSSIPVQVIIWGKLSTLFPIAIFAILLLNQKHQYCSMYFHPILTAFTDEL